MKDYGVVFKVLVDYRVETDNDDDAIEKAKELFLADERFKEFYGELYCVDYYDEDGMWHETEYLC